MHPVSRKVLALVGVVGLAADTACYAYVPVSPRAAPVSTGSAVRVTLTTGGTEDLARYLGPRVYAVDGSVASIDPRGDPVIGVTWVQLVDGSRQPWMGEGVVTFPPADVAGVAVHTLDRRKSYIVAALVGIGLATIAYTALQGGGGNIRDNPGDGNPLGLRAPAIRPH